MGGVLANGRRVVRQPHGHTVLFGALGDAVSTRIETRLLHEIENLHVKGWFIAAATCGC